VRYATARHLSGDAEADQMLKDHEEVLAFVKEFLGCG
jgi:hypothetical protein